MIGQTGSGNGVCGHNELDTIYQHSHLKCFSDVNVIDMLFVDYRMLDENYN